MTYNEELELVLSRLESDLDDRKYRQITGTGIKDTLDTYSGLAALVGFAAGAVGGIYLANEVMELLAADATAAVRYAVDGLTALILGIGAAAIAGGIGHDLGVDKVKRVLYDCNKVERVLDV